MKRRLQVIFVAAGLLLGSGAGVLKAADTGLDMVLLERLTAQKAFRDYCDDNEGNDESFVACVVNADNVSLRIGPTTASEKKLVLSKGTEVSVVGIVESKDPRYPHEWYEVLQYDHESGAEEWGFIYSDLVSVDDDYYGLPMVGLGVVSGPSGATLREGPSTSYAKQTLLPRGSQLVIYEMKASEDANYKQPWCEVSVFDGNGLVQWFGYVYSGLVKVVGN